MTRIRGFSVEPGWRTFLADLGIEPRAVLRRAALPEDLFSRENARLNASEHYRLWEAIEREADDPRFPLLLAEVLRAEAFHPAIFAGLCSPNMLVAMKRIAHYKPLISELRLRLVEGPTEVKLIFDWPDTGVPAPRTMVLAEYVFFVALARLATRERIRPVRITSDILPDLSGEYEEYFGIRIRKGEERAVTFSRADVERPFLTHNEAMWKTFEPSLQKRMSELDNTATTFDRVHAVLLEALPAGDVAIGDVAERLAMSRRTLQRRLSDEGTTFREVLDHTREALARHYLERTRLTSAEISFLLGFEEPNSFSRAFHRWTGETPDSVRHAYAR